MSTHYKNPNEKSNLDIVKDCDNFPYYEPGCVGWQSSNTLAYESQIASLWTFYLPDDMRPHGYMLDSVVAAMPWGPEGVSVEPKYRQISMDCPAAGCETAIDELLDRAREHNVFPKLGKKRDEKFAIMGANFSVGIERSASSLFGIIGQGVHMTVYTKTESGLKFWIPQRNLNKSTYPGALDNTVAGGVAAGESPFECLVREASEEAAMTEEMVRKNAVAAGTVTWFNVSDERSGGYPGLMNPGVLYVYDLEVGPDVVFQPVDGDVHAFHLMDVKEVHTAMMQRKFKPASANVMMDFFVRHGLITADNDEDYAEIVSRLHRKLPFPTIRSQHWPKPHHWDGTV